MTSSGELSGTEIPTDIARLPVGSALRTRREQLGWTLPEVAAWLRIRLPYLEALESGQVGQLPGSAYAMGFLRAYATALGLDADDMIRRFRGETKDATRKPELSFPVPVPERGVPAGAIMLLGVVMVVAAYVGWYELGGHTTHEAHTVPPVPEALTPYAGSGGRGPSPQVASVMPGPGQTPSAVPPGGADAKPAGQADQKPAGASPETAGVVADMPAATSASANTPATMQQPGAVSPSMAGATGAMPGGTAAGTAAGVASGTPSAPVSGSSADQPAQTAGSSAAGAPAVVAGQVTVNALANSWVQVRQVGGKVIYDHVLQAGEHWSVPADAGDVVLSTGNAGGVTVSADGVTSPVLGRVGGVRRGIPLSAEAVRSGSIAASSPVSGSADKAAAAAVAPGPTGVVPSNTGATTGITAGTAAGATSTGGVATRPVDIAPVSESTAGSGAQPMVRPHTALHRPAAAGTEDETERLNRAQLKQPALPQ